MPWDEAARDECGGFTTYFQHLHFSYSTKSMVAYMPETEPTVTTK